MISHTSTRKEKKELTYNLLGIPLITATAAGLNLNVNRTVYSCTVDWVDLHCLFLTCSPGKLKIATVDCS